jgi:uncharacterized protein (TIGR03437 family)
MAALSQYLDPQQFLTYGATERALGGIPALSPGGLATVTGTNLASSAAQAAAVPLPRVLENACVSVEGMRTPLLSTAAGSIEFQGPGDIPGGDASIVVFLNGAMTSTADVAVQASAPAISAVVHAGGSAPPRLPLQLPQLPPCRRFVSAARR